MPEEIYVRKMYDSFVPVDIANLEVMEELTPGAEYKATLSRPRNIKFHRKLFALLKLGYDAFHPEMVSYKGIVAEKDMDRFRHDITILAGHYKAVINIKGEVRLEAKSISFAKMDEEKFEKFYSSVINVILKEVMINYNEEELRQTVDEILGFA